MQAETGSLPHAAPRTGMAHLEQMHQRQLLPGLGSGVPMHDALGAVNLNRALSRVERELSATSQERRRKTREQSPLQGFASLLATTHTVSDIRVRGRSTGQAARAGHAVQCPSSKSGQRAGQLVMRGETRARERALRRLRLASQTAPLEDAKSARDA